MCILFIAINQHKDYPLIIGANRDEFHLRPTKSAHFWPGSDKILAGLDLQAGGTWLGVNGKGEFSALTNIRSGKAEPAAQSRGELVTKALQSPALIDLNWLKQHSNNYNPFNLIYSQNQQLFCYNSQSQKQSPLGDGFHAICNGALDDVWPKMAKGERLLEQLISEQKTLNPEHIFAIMKDQTQAPDELLPNTGVGIEWERLLSSIFIQSTDYGTRSTTVIMQHHSGSIDFYEQSYTTDGSIFNKQQFALAKS
ncbi:NRDE family protein [Thalassomonas sp. M1454]|uniref:NRDE family protein n=1 Tax=Thalassomonas sp. M1454 TaxID=2594477 RepID=UPI001180AB62|nr:NRDE family protein [Thalassomonas sp. M1454]TRX55866.1 NRDE family protein [Thalassomonas sp. M1454]